MSESAAKKITRNRRLMQVPVGSVFGYLTTLTPVRRVEGLTAGQVRCRCQCGAELEVGRYELVHGKMQSCGCKRGALVSASKIKHGDASKRLYRIWKDMRKRCTNPNVDAYEHYGGRGIRVCEAWQSYEAFRDWALSNGYSDALSIDRKDVDGDYCPDNCHWIPSTQQKANTRVNNRVTAFGETKTITEWERDPRCPVRADTIRDRIRRGMSEQEAVQTPLLRRNMFTVSPDWAKD